MALSAIDPKSALVLVDLQKGITRIPGAPYTPAEVIERGARLATAFRLRGLPVVLVNVTGTPPGRIETPLSGRGGEAPAPDWADLVPELDIQDTDIHVTKQSWGAFYGTSLDLELRRRGVTQVVLGGIATRFGVESTARAAHEHGYNVTVAVDACTDMSADGHRASVEGVFPRLGETATTAEILATLT
ncbi:MULTISPECIES: isochorismatase family protein [unclassified Streptomyces]|uniref:isochorismatase family protein n=1 Tax=unclassified Streptomyces TaxID=2593676 RepID=UPI002DD8DA5D|nr:MULTISPECIES: isochorismatase family protein [unclassified Streptomyces]WSA91540.1 isochorismatase family protein [Streptomyces sp. NBC_01795]WSB75910.1 isochorismatase family protein [Streptomyces sp. NBC_01775]WSS15814.1 isochorismatase family protein [Streptomyces sp. NBC_01186]WSS44653.1 isochorismatase family protein [Streptomyces sp. NBC_01187]